MTHDDILMLWVHDEITFDGMMWILDTLHPVPTTPAKTVLRPLAESAPTLFALRERDAAIELKAAA